MSNSSGDARKAFPCLEMVFIKPGDVVALTGVSLLVQSMSRRTARTVFTAGDFPVSA